MINECPYCSAESLPGGKGYYSCGTFNNCGCIDTFPQGALCRERAAHAETRKRADEFEGWFKAAQANYERTRKELQRSRAKWDRLREWVREFEVEYVLAEMNRLDAEEKGGK